MRHSFILLFLLFSTCLMAQSWVEKRDAFYALLQKGDYESAVKSGEELLPLMTKDSSYADVAFYLANTYAALQNFDKAVEHAQTEATIRAKVQGKKNGYYLNAVYYLASYLSSVGRSVEAIELYLEVYAEMKKQYPGTDNTITMAQSLADMCYQAGVIKKAQELYEDSWEWIRSSRNPTDSVYINMSYTLGDFYIQNGQPEKSIPFFEMECSRQEKVNGKKSNAYMQAHNSWGEMCIMAGQYAKAKKVYTEFVSLAESIYGKKSADYATALNNLAITYEKQSEFEEAEKLYLKSLAIKEKVYKKESDFYALTLSNMGVLYDMMGNYEKAESKLDEALAIYEKIYSGDNSNYAVALNNIASVYSGSGKYDKAIEVIQRSLEMNKKIAGEASNGYIIALNSMASIYQSKGDYEKAEKYYLEALPLYEKVLGKNHSDYGTVLFNLANVNFAKGKYAVALDHIEQSLDIQEASVGKVHDNYAKALQTEASILTELGQTRKAEEKFEEAGEIMRELYGELHPDYAVYLNNFGYFLFQKGDYQKSEENLNSALKIQYAALGESHPENISLLSNIGNLMIQKQNYKAAETNLLKALDIARQHYQLDQPEYSNVLNNLATLYYQLGNYDKAEPYYLQAMESRKKFYGDKHTEYATSLNNLGTLYLSKAGAAEDIKSILSLSEKSISYFSQALALDSLNFGMDHPEIALHLNNLAEAYRTRNEFDKAEKLYLRSIELEEKHHGSEHPKLATGYHNLSLLYAGIGQFEKAEKAATQSIALYEKCYGKNSPYANDAQMSLAYIYQGQKKIEKAKDLYSSVLQNQKRILEQNFSFLSESEKESYLKTLKASSDIFSTFAFRYQQKDASLSGMVYNNEIYNKGLLFRSSSRVKDIVFESRDEELMLTYKDWMDKRQELSILYSTPAAERSKDLQKTEEEANTLEKRLVSRSVSIKNALENSTLQWSDIKSKLKPGQAAIEFVHFIQYDSLSEDTYFALVITSQSKQPEMIRLFSASEWKGLIGDHSGTTYESVSEFYGKRKSLNIDLFALLWGPLEKTLSGIQEIYYSPTGLLHKISFASLGDANGRFVSDKYVLHQLNSTASILQLSPDKIEPTQSIMAMIGGVKYDTENSTQHIWSYLPGTLTETEHIQGSLTKAGVKTEMFTSDMATEENMKKMDGEKSPDILHVATHGFFFGEPGEQKEVLETKSTAVTFRGESRGIKTLVENPNPLMRSGIVLAGANDVWNESKPGGKINQEDGILTAYEVSLMDLQNTQLVVLSACETGLGDIKGSEGVYGLQRAFRIAGADKMIMSLWQVPDKETDEFMTSFYNELIKTKEIRKAFTNAQKVMREKYDPYFWGAFVLIE